MEFKATAPEEIRMTLTATMTIKEWLALKSQMNAKADEAYYFAQDIDEMVESAKKHFYPKP